MAGDVQVCVQGHDRGTQKGKQVIEGEGVFEDGDRKFQRSFSDNLRSYAILDTKFEFEDYEGVMYKELYRNINWGEVYEEEW